MSGPKVSVYTLTAEELAAWAAELERQLQEMERREALLERARAYESRLTEYERALPLLQQSLQRSEGWVDTKSFAAGMKAATEKLASCRKLLTSIVQAQDNAQAERGLAELAAIVPELEAVFSEQREQGLVLEQWLADALDTTVAGLFRPDAAPQETKEAKGASEQSLPAFVRSDVETLLSLKDNRYLTLTYRRIVEQAIAHMRQAQQEQRLVSFCEVELPDVLTQCRAFLSLWQSSGNRYLQLLRRYEALCQMNGSQPELVPFAEEAAGRLSSLIAAEEASARAAAEQAYIRQAMDEVMAEMGYDVLGDREVRKRDGRHFANELYRCEGDTAVSVTYADDGQIAIEFGKTDDRDRLPTQAESAELVRQMHAFCQDFEEIEARLAAHGVCLDKRIALTPPSADYAQIINLRDYAAAPRADGREAGRARQKKQPAAARQAGEPE